MQVLLAAMIHWNSLKNNAMLSYYLVTTSSKTDN
jgi:hypothetical protein